MRSLEVHFDDVCRVDDAFGNRRREPLASHPTRRRREANRTEHVAVVEDRGGDGSHAGDLLLVVSGEPVGTHGFQFGAQRRLVGDSVRRPPDKLVVLEDTVTPVGVDMSENRFARGRNVEVLPGIALDLGVEVFPDGVGAELLV